MSAKPNDGGPAFPRTVTMSDGIGLYSVSKNDGMTLRHWFAGLAMESIFAPIMKDAYQRLSDASAVFDNVAIASYAMADAMLAASERKEETNE